MYCFYLLLGHGEDAPPLRTQLEKYNLQAVLRAQEVLYNHQGLGLRVCWNPEEQSQLTSGLTSCMTLRTSSQDSVLTWAVPTM